MPGRPSCQTCGAPAPADARFCSACGAAVASLTDAGSRRHVTIVFTDVVGSTALGERLDAESLGGLMTRYYETMRDAIERHGGAVEKFIGDAVDLGERRDAQSVPELGARGQILLRVG